MNFMTLNLIFRFKHVQGNGAFQKGMPHKFYHGKTGRVFNVTKRAVGVILNKPVGWEMVIIIIIPLCYIFGYKRLHVKYSFFFFLGIASFPSASMSALSMCTTRAAERTSSVEWRRMRGRRGRLVRRGRRSSASDSLLLLARDTLSRQREKSLS